MRNRLAIWLWRHVVAPSVLAYLVENKVTGDRLILTRSEVKVVFRGGPRR